MYKSVKHPFIFISLIISLFLVLFFSACYGAVKITFNEIINALTNEFTNQPSVALNERIFMDIRLPRTLLSVFVGATLAVGGILVQSLFKNPIVEPGLIGTSSGAAFGAAFFIVLGNTFDININEFSLPLLACLGGILGTFLVFIFSKSSQSKSIVVLLLIGVAINALFVSGIGFLSYIARDPQARSITFWNLGTISGANWNAVSIVGTTTIIGTILSVFLSKNLNTLILGDEEANYLGVNIKTLKIKVLLINVLMVSIATSFVGVISFIGLIVPHLIRITIGSDNKYLLIYGALLGGILLCLSDLLARIIISPAELPIGIVTSFVGVPIFILLLRKKNSFY